MYLWSWNTGKLNRYSCLPWPCHILPENFAKDHVHGCAWHASDYLEFASHMASFWTCTCRLDDKDHEKSKVIRIQHNVHPVQFKNSFQPWLIWLFSILFKDTWEDIDHRWHGFYLATSTPHCFQVPPCIPATEKSNKNDKARLHLAKLANLFGLHQRAKKNLYHSHGSQKSHWLEHLEGK